MTNAKGKDSTNKGCVLQDSPCVNCGQCDRCDLNPEKICDNCMTCVVLADYRSMKIEKVIPDSTEGTERKNYRWIRRK